jgi:hypothetical protein
LYCVSESSLGDAPAVLLRVLVKEGLNALRSFGIADFVGVGLRVKVRGILQQPFGFNLRGVAHVLL